MHCLWHSMALGGLLATASAQTVFSSDFNTTVPAEISPGSATLTSVQGYAGLGPIGNTFGGTFLRSETGNVVTLTLTGLPVHTSLRLDFLFAAIDSLDGAGVYPTGDWLQITLDGTTICRESFANAVPSQIQTYSPPPGVQLARHQDLGFTNGPGSYFSDSAYFVGGDPFFTSIAHSAATATFTFAIEGPGIQPLADESWAMDNLRVQIEANTRGSAAAYGASCGPVLRATSVPRIGQALGLSLSSLPANTGVAFGAFGVSQAMLGVAVLPIPLDWNGMPGCWIVQDLSLWLTLPFALTGPAGAAAIPIPNSAGFIGLQMFGQGWAIAPGANAAGIVTSNGVRLRVGVLTSAAITEDFANETFLDRDRSGGTWVSGTANFAQIGGDGRHGTFAPELGVSLGVIGGKRTFQFDTNNTIIPATNTFTGASMAVTDGRFFFDSMAVANDVRLRFVGNTPPQFTVAGRLDIQGEIDVAGQTLTTMPFSSSPTGQLGGVGGIFGGNGGQGGDKCHGLGAQANFHGRPGQDARVLGGRAYASSVVGSGGQGSTVFPANGLSTSLIFGTGGTVMYSPSASAGGAGGGHLAAGQAGLVVSNNHPDPILLIPPRLDAMGPPSVAGTAVQYFPFPPVSGSSLSSQHFLVGGAGGGGAASHAALCFHLSRVWAPGAGGGGGGGAISLRAGDVLNLGAPGRVFAHGGAAANGVGVTASAQAAPGGGGSGGSIVLQAGRVAALSGIVTVNGGVGGLYNRFANGVPNVVPFSAAVHITGGNGASGFVRCEVPGTPTTALLANMVPPPIAQNVAPLTEVDTLVSCRSTFYSTGLLVGPEYVRYEIHATVGGVPIVYSDDPAVSTVQAQVGAAVRAWFQAATLDVPGGQVLATRPWRTSVRDPLTGIAADALNGFRFLLVVDHAIAQQVTIDRLVVAYDI